jgi:hypothetical protein
VTVRVGAMQRGTLLKTFLARISPLLLFLLSAGSCSDKPAPAGARVEKITVPATTVAEAPTPVRVDSASTDSDSVGPFEPLSAEDVAALSRRLAHLTAWWHDGRPHRFPNLVSRAALSWWHTPYESGRLDTIIPEALMIHTSGLSCVTFLELSLAMARTVACNEYSLASVQQRLARLRYRGGRIVFERRLHYFEDWVTQASADGTVTDISRSLGGVPIQRPFDFITNHRYKYPQLGDPAALSTMRAVEERLSTMTFYYVPRERVAKIASELNEGDILAVINVEPGLLVSHVAFVYIMNKYPHVIHASSAFGFVGVTADTLPKYLQKKDDRLGIMVMRPLPPVCSP